MYEEMVRDDRVFVIGEDVDIEGGVFNFTRRIVEELGPQRCVGTPISEGGFVGLSVGAAATGLRPIVEIMYMDFIMLAMDQLVNQMAKLRYMSGGQFTMPVTIRAQSGHGTRESAQHSQSLEAVATMIPGLKVVAPVTPADAKGLLKTAIRDDNPVMFLESELAYAWKDEVPDGEHLVEIGKALVKRPGNAVTIVTYGQILPKALAAAEQLQQQGIDAEVIDLRTLRPLDEETVICSVEKTNRGVIVDEASMMDQHLLYRILSCTSDKCRLVFVGDAAQLPSVGPGNVLRDLINSGKFPTVNLTEIFRQKDTFFATEPLGLLQTWPLHQA